MASKTYMKPTIFRAGVVKGFDQKPEISREGGEFDAGYIKNFAVITKGEALGHGAWVDDTFVAQVAEQLAFAKKGIKARYTHPNQCGDSLSKGLGRVFYRLSEDGKVRGDLHFWKAAHKTPDGDLAGFLIDMAEDDPEAFGASISFLRDAEAMEQFSLENPESPDPLNVTPETIPIGLPLVWPEFEVQVAVAPPKTSIVPALAAEIEAREPHKADKPTFVNLFMFYISPCIKTLVIMLLLYHLCLERYHLYNFHYQLMILPL